jgi:Flp pilus assembly protein TadD/predicted aspartyl protease
MKRIPVVAAALASIYLATVGLRAQTAADVQLQLGDLFFSEGRYTDARDPYARAARSDDATISARAGTGLVLALLRTGEFQKALDTAVDLGAKHPSDATIGAIRGDARWSMGRFEVAESDYEAALAIDVTQPRAHHGRGRSLAAQNRLTEGLAEVTEAIRLNPREPEFRHTLATIYERLRQFDDAAVALSSFIDLLPNHDRSEKAAWARAEIRFLESFKGRQPFAIDPPPPLGLWTMPIRISGDKVMIAGKVNGGSQDFVLDTGAERTIISLDVARRRGIMPITTMQTAGVGNVGLRGLQAGRIDVLQIGDLKIHNVPCLIKNPPLGGLPAREPESFSPLALGLSMRIDYEHRQLTLGSSLPQGTYVDQLPLRMHRLALVHGTVNGSLPATFVVDTGGELISISDTTAGLIQPTTPFRRIPLRVYGTSGWDKEAFLMPGVDLEFSRIRFTRIPVVVLNLRAPSALLGFQLGGIVGHRFLSKYLVTIDLVRSVVGLS